MQVTTAPRCRSQGDQGLGPPQLAADPTLTLSAEFKTPKARALQILPELAWHPSCTGSLVSTTPLLEVSFSLIKK